MGSLSGSQNIIDFMSQKVEVDCRGYRFDCFLQDGSFGLGFS